MKVVEDLFLGFVENLFLCTSFYGSFVFLMLLHLFIAALLSLAGKELTSWLLMVMFIVVLFIIVYGILGQVWYLMVSFPDLCPLSYFKRLMVKTHLLKKLC